MLEVFELTVAAAQLFSVCSYFWDDGKIRRVSSLNQEAVRSAPPSKKSLRVLVRVEEDAGSSTGAMLQKVLLHQTRRKYAGAQVRGQCDGTDKWQPFHPIPGMPSLVLRFIRIQTNYLFNSLKG